MLSFIISVSGDGLTAQTIETRIKLAYALARQWFGVYITPEAPNDGNILFFMFAPVIVEKSQSEMVAVILSVRVVGGWSCWVSY